MFCPSSDFHAQRRKPKNDHRKPATMASQCDLDLTPAESNANEVRGSDGSDVRPLL